jgi:hypothetical protein
MVLAAAAAEFVNVQGCVSLTCHQRSGLGHWATLAGPVLGPLLLCGWTGRLLRCTAASFCCRSGMQLVPPWLTSPCDVTASNLVDVGVCLRPSDVLMHCCAVTRLCGVVRMHLSERYRLRDVAK